MRFVVAGASGFLGQAWAGHLRREGHEVFRLVRRATTAPDESEWDPVAGEVNQDLVESAQVVANLAGVNLAHWPWTEGFKREFLESRTKTTRTLAEAVARATTSAGGPAFVAQNGIAGYGDRGEEVVTEATPTDGTSFLADVCRQWEAATRPAAEAGARVVVLRTAVVLDRRGGALKTMLPAFKAGLGGPIGSGEQRFATLTLTDWLAAATYLATAPGCSGAYNLTAPGTPTNAEFSEQLAHALHRPSFLKVPALPLRKLGGEAGQELLSSTRVEPTRLLAEGFTFAHPTLSERIAAGLR